MQRYTSQALKLLKNGPRELVDPEKEFINNDMEDFLRYKCTEISPSKYQCEICKKLFMAQDFVIKHIRNKHEDVVNETYERASTKEWLSRNIQQKMKKEMKQNYYNDENKLFNQPGRRYHNSETSYFFNKDGDQQNRGQNNYQRGKQGIRGNRNFKKYVDFDDPKTQETRDQQKNESRELVDYSDLFG